MGSDLSSPAAKRALGLLRALYLSALAFGVLVCSGMIIDQGVDFIVRHVTLDDSYYYLNTAWNTRQLGWVTFDGHNPTNGVQFLWFWLLYAFSFLFDSRESFLLGALWLCAVIGALSVLAAWRLGVLLRGLQGGLLMAGFVAYGVIDVAYLRVLENTIHLLIFLLIVDQYLRLLRDRSQGVAGSPSRFLILITLLSLNAWCRLDAGAVSAVIGLHASWVVWRDPSRRLADRVRLLAVAVATCGGAASLQLVVYRLMGGSFLPVSGLWKTGAAELSEVPSLLWLWWGRPLGQIMPLERAVSADAIYASAIALTALALSRGWLGARRRGDADASVNAGLAVVAVGLLLHALCMLFLVDATALRRGFWYQAPHMALMAMLVTAALDRIRLRGSGRGALIARRSTDAMICVVLGLLVYYGAKASQQFVAKRIDRDNFHGVRLDLARWIDTNLEPGARLGAFNSGELGYYSRRPVTNLDGLINSFAYREYRRRGGTVADYLVGEGIDYFVDYLTEDGIAEVTELVRSRPIPKVDPIEVRRVIRPRNDGK